MDRVTLHLSEQEARTIMYALSERATLIREQAHRDPDNPHFDDIIAASDAVGYLYSDVREAIDAARNGEES